MGWDEALERERKNRDTHQQHLGQVDALWAQGATDSRQVLSEFLELMRKAGNPGLRTFKQSRSSPGSQGSFKELLPKRTIHGWQVGHGKVITPEGQIYAKLLDKDEVINHAEALDDAWFHATSIDGKSYSPFTAQEIREVLAPVLIDAGAVR
jgi:hypothetical protein